MTNDALVRIFFMGVATGKEESYGFSVKPLLRERVGNFALFSKTSQFPMARKLSENYFIISTPGTGLNSRTWKSHLTLATTITKQIGVGLLASPLTDETKFQKYMERKINNKLSFLARSSSIAPILKPELILTELYQNLVKDIRTLLEGEILLKLPKYYVTLLDTDEAQCLWGWLIKENPDKKDRELLREMYMLSRLLGSSRREEEDRKCGLITTPSPRNKIG